MNTDFPMIPFPVFEDFTSIADWFFTAQAVSTPERWQDFLILAKEVSLDEWRTRTIKKETLQKTPTWKDVKNDMRFVLLQIVLEILFWTSEALTIIKCALYRLYKSGNKYCYCHQRKVHSH
jgi:hypothetical protein